jgi:hypothetical protein
MSAKPGKWFPKAEAKRQCAVCHFKVGIGLKWSAKILCCSPPLCAKAKKACGATGTTGLKKWASFKKLHNWKIKAVSVLSSELKTETKALLVLDHVWNKHPEYVRFVASKRSVKYERDRLTVDSAFKILKRFRTRLWKKVGPRSKSRDCGSIDLIGLSKEQFTAYLEQHFLPGMTWDNYGMHGWHIDHVRPCASFDLTDPTQVRECFHFSNLRPLWARDNWKKNSRHKGLLIRRKRSVVPIETKRTASYAY